MAPHDWWLQQSLEAELKKTQLCLSAAKPPPSPPFSAGAEVLGQNRGSLLNCFPKTNLQPTQPQRNHPSWVRVPVKRPSAENSTNIIFYLELNGTSTTSNNHRRRTTLPKNRLFVIGIIFLLSARPLENSFAMQVSPFNYYSIWQLTTPLFQPIDLCFVSMFFSKNSTFLLKVLHSAQKNY